MLSPSPEKKEERNDVVPKRSDSHLVFLDHVRGWAIFLVFVFHCLRHATDLNVGINSSFFKMVPFSRLTAVLFPVSLGWIGVPIFFVVSGFCIHLSHVRSKEKGFKTFFIRRFFRIYPAYLVSFLFFALFFPPTRLDVHSPHWAGDLIAHFFLIHDLDWKYMYSVNGALWSISVEAQLYLIYPLLLWLTARWGWRNSLVIALMAEATFLFVPDFLRHSMPERFSQLEWLNGGPFRFWFSWSIGACIADDWLAGRPIFLTRCPLWLWPGIFLIGSVLPVLHVLCFTFAALATAVVFAKLLSRTASVEVIASTPWSRHFRGVGIVSYSTYLLHEPLLWLGPVFVRWLLPTLPLPRLALFVIFLLEWPFILMAAWGLYRFVEVPAIALGKSIIRGQKKPSLHPSRS